MFDIGFFELLVIAIVGLVVIGPERLPGAVRTCALWIGRIKRSIADTRLDIEQQLGADEIRRQLRNEQILHNLEKMKDTRMDLEARINQFQASLDPSQQNQIGTTLEHEPEPNSEADAQTESTPDIDHETAQRASPAIATEPHSAAAPDAEVAPTINKSN